MSKESSDIDTEKIANGETQEWRKLVDHYNQILIRHAYKIIRDTQSANDIAQTVLLNLWARRSIAIHIKSLRAYLVLIDRNDQESPCCSVWVR